MLTKKILTLTSLAFALGLAAPASAQSCEGAFGLNKNYCGVRYAPFFMMDNGPQVHPVDTSPSNYFWFKPASSGNAWIHPYLTVVLQCHNLGIEKTIYSGPFLPNQTKSCWLAGGNYPLARRSSCGVGC